MTHYKEKNCLVDGPLSNLQPSMIQFSRPRKALSKAMEQFRRHEVSAKDVMINPTISGFSDSASLPLFLFTIWCSYVV